MDRRDELLERYEDALFELLLNDLFREEGKRLEAESELLRQSPFTAVPEELDVQCRKLIETTFAKK